MSETTAARTPGSFAMSAPSTPLFVAENAGGHLSVWLENPDGDDHELICRDFDIPAVGRDVLWQHITKGLPRRYDDTPDSNPHRSLSGHDNARKRAED
jgi:hypothetical protein